MEGKQKLRTTETHQNRPICAVRNESDTFKSQLEDKVHSGLIGGKNIP